MDKHRPAGLYNPSQHCDAPIMNEYLAIQQHACRSKLDLPLPCSHTVVIVESGMGTLRLNGRKFSFGSGKCFYSLPDMPISIEPYFNEAVFYTIAFHRLGARVQEGEQIIFTRQYEGFAAWGELGTRQPERLLRLASEMTQIKQTEHHAEAAKLQALFHECLLELTIDNTPHVERGDNKEDTLLKIADYIRVHYSKDLKRSEVARMAGFTPEYFSALFKQVVGKNLTQFITTLRIRHIQERLLFDGARLLEAAREVGYKDEHYASRRFKQEVGFSPTSYMRSSKTIVSMSPHLTMHLLALGLSPAATLAYPWRFGEFDQTLRDNRCLVRDWSEGFTTTELLALQPDIILTIDNLEKEQLHAYRELAPTLVIPWYGNDWRGHFHQLAETTGQRETKQSWLDTFERRCGSLRRQLNTAGLLGRSLLIVNIRASTAYLYVNRGMGSQVVYGELGFTVPLELQRLSISGASITVNLEDILPRFASDIILLVVENTPLAIAKAEAMLSEASWSQFLAEGGMIYRADMSRWHGYDPLSNLWQLEDMEAWFSL